MRTRVAVKRHLNAIIYRNIIMTTLLSMKKELAKIQDITQDPDFENKPLSIQRDMIVRESDCKTEIALAMIAIQRSHR